MDSFEWNKIIGAVLGTALVIVAIYVVVPGLMAPEKPKAPGMEVAATEPSATPGATPAVELPPDWGTVLPAADVAAGENISKRCLQCHDFTKGGPHKIGPNQWGVVGAHHAHAPDYAYSTAMKALADKIWDYDALNAFLTNPKAAVPGTKMAFAGLSKTADRVNLVAWLRLRSDSPFPIPPPKPAAAPAETTTPAAPTEGTPPAADGAAEPPAGEVQAPPPGGAAAPGAAPSTPPAQPGSGGH